MVWKNNPVWSDQDIEEIRGLALAGWSIRDVARRKDSTPSSISGVARRNGIKFLGNWGHRAPDDKPTRVNPDTLLKRF